MENALGIFHSDTRLSLPQLWRNLFHSSPWESGEVPEGKIHEAVGPCKALLHSLSHLHASPHLSSLNSTKLSFKCSYQFMALLPFPPGKQLYYFALLLWRHLFSKSQDNILFSDFYFSDGPKKSHWFSVFPEFFLNTRARHTTPSSLHVKADTSQFGDIKIRLVLSSH